MLYSREKQWQALNIFLRKQICFVMILEQNFPRGNERWKAEMTDNRFLPSIVGYFQRWLTMSFLLASSEVHLFSSKYAVPSFFITISKRTDPGEQLLSVCTKMAVCLHNYFSLEQPSQSSLRKRTQPQRDCWGRAGSSMVSSSQKMLWQQFPHVLTTVNRCSCIAFSSPADLKALCNGSTTICFPQAEMISPLVI